MRVVLVNWARIWDGPARGGGVNGYCQGLALELVRRGHDVVSLCSGQTYLACDRSGRPGPCQLRRHPDWLGVRVFEVINSPVLAPSIAQFADPLGELAAPALEREIARLFALLQPDVIHFQSLEGFSIGCVDAARAACGPTGPARVLFSLHNYHTVCPQVYLMHRHRIPCDHFDAGHRCAVCVAARNPAQVQRERARAAAGPAQRAAETPRTPRAILAAAARSLRTRARQLWNGTTRSAAPPLPGWPVRDPDDVLTPRPVPGRDRRGNTPLVLGELGPVDAPDWTSEEWQPASNAIAPEPHCTLPPNDFGRRRHAMLQMLGRCDSVLAVSQFVRRKFIAVGLDPALVITEPIGTRLNELVARHREMIFEPPPIDPDRPRPIRLVFLGHNNWFKGLPMLADALELLTPEYLRRLDLHLYASDLRTIEWRFRRLEPRLAGLTIRHGYDQRDLPWLLGGKDAGIVPSVWWDNAPQTVFEFQACGVPVLAADLGGIPEFVQHGHDGLLFRGNDRFDLARTLVRVIREPTLLARLRRNVTPPRSMADHVDRLERLYATASHRGPALQPDPSQAPSTAPADDSPASGARRAAPVPQRSTT